MIHRSLVLCLFLVASAAQAQPPAPPPPAKYKVTLRYYIPAPRDQHVMQYDAMIRHLQSLDFEFDPPIQKHPETDREDRSKNYLHGYVASGNALKLLDATVVQSMLLIPYAPNEFKLPAAPDDPVSVRLQLAGKLAPARQRELANQTRVLLRELGFKEPIGYDQHGYLGRPYTRIVGTIRRGKLDILLRDLRNHPAGWLRPTIPRDEIPPPLREVNPVQVIEVLPDPLAVKELPEPQPRGFEFLEKISADLWELVKDKDVPPTPIPVQVGLIGKINLDDDDWKQFLRDKTPGFFIEGRLGNFATGVMRLDQVKPLSASPLIGVIRLPRVQPVNVDPAVQIAGDNAKALEQAGLTALHKAGHRGQGVRVGIIDADFRGWETLVKKKLLPARTRLVDLTFDRDPDGYPQPYPGDPDQIGHGTLCAQAAALAAPDLELTLIRAEVHDPYQLHEIVGYTQAGKLNPRIERSYGEVVARGARLRVRRGELLQERKIILENFTDETDQAAFLGFLGPFYAWLYSDREWHRQRMAFQENLEEEHRRREERFGARLADVASLKGIGILVNALSWNSGYPLGAVSGLSRALDDPKGPLWFQAAGNTRGQTWFGPYRNTPGDPTLQFTDGQAQLPKGRWSNEINFLQWQPFQGDAMPALPAKAKLRLTLQWREAHDPDYYLRADEPDEYLTPLHVMRLQLLRQRDPLAKTLPADAFELTARTVGYPERIEHLPSGSVYQHAFETTLEDAGHYAIRVEKLLDSYWIFEPHPIRKTPVFRRLTGLTPSGLRPLGAPTLPALEKNSELRVRVFVEVIDDAHRLQGRAVFADYPTEMGSIGIPADARNVFSVGAASLENKPQPYSVYGSPAGMELARRPWLYAYDQLELAAGGAFGATIANAFAAGTAAAMRSAGLSREQTVRFLRTQEGWVVRASLPKK